ncbi:Stress induced protein [Quillaja saponaria]|uniref:Stress induced protein n=1 Tax=Quillaja saponaria TaxID=32244 RepID=A0AAD7PJ31_QUISA|nr:Stress induced protein [Quillaja saponaria]
MAVFEGQPIKENEAAAMDDYEEAVSASGYGCGCFQLFGFNGRLSNGIERKCILQQKGEGNGEAWLIRKLQKLKEVSEVLAGPKWKTLIRKSSGYINGKKKQRNRFQYDEQSYALNFDCGVDREEEDKAMLLEFSAMFAPPDAGRQLPKS